MAADLGALRVARGDGALRCDEPRRARDDRARRRADSSGRRDRFVRGEVRLLEARQDALLRERTQFAVDKLAITPPEADWRENADLVAREHALRKASDAIAAGLSEAEDRAVSQINALARDTYRISAGSSLFPAALTGSAAWATVLASFDEAIESTGIGFLESLLRTSNLSEWAAAHPERLRALLDAAPSADLVREWWSTLDDDAHEALIAGVPLLVGNLNGIPLGDRAKANGLNIEAEIARLHRLNADLATRYGYDDHYRRIPGTVAFAPTIAANTALIASYGLLLHDPKAPWMVNADGQRQRLSPPTIVAFDPVAESFVHYSGFLDPVSRDLPSTTTNVAFLAPGTGTNPTNWSTSPSKATKIIRALPDEHSQVGIFTWAGGALPQNVDAALAERSQDLGPKLASFVNSVRPTTTATLTGIGYSYGGAVLGQAEKAGVHLDRSLAISSAGLGHGVSSVSDYRFTSDIPHYSMMAPGDPLALSQGLQAGSLGHGASPLHAESGYVRLETGYKDSEVGAASGLVTGHTGVWAPHSDVVVQAGQVIVGGDLTPYSRNVN